MRRITEEGIGGQIIKIDMSIQDRQRVILKYRELRGCRCDRQATERK